MTNLDDERYRKLLRWYPRAWRDRNENVVAGVLAEQAAAEGRSGPTASDRRDLFLAGLRARFTAEGRPSRPTVVAFALATVFSVFYVGVITWSPGVRYAGAIGPFTNGTVIAAAFLLAAFVCSLSRRPGAARFFAVAAVVVEMFVWAVGFAVQGLGPTLVTALLFSGLALVGGLLPRSTSELIKVLSGCVLVLVAVYFAPMIITDVQILLDPASVSSPPSEVVPVVGVPMIAWALVQVAALAGAVLLFVSAGRRRAHLARRD